MHLLLPLISEIAVFYMSLISLLTVTFPYFFFVVFFMSAVIFFYSSQEPPQKMCSFDQPCVGQD